MYLFEPFFQTLLHLLRLWEDHMSTMPLTGAKPRSISNAIKSLCYDVNPHTISCIRKGLLVKKKKKISRISLVKWLIYSPGQVPYCIAQRWQTGPGRQFSLLTHVWNAPWLPPRLVLLHPVLFFLLHKYKHGYTKFFPINISQNCGALRSIWRACWTYRF